MGLFSDSFSSKWANKRHSTAIENAVLELSDEISSIKAAIARINAKLAVSSRISATERLTAEEKELKKLEKVFGGTVIDVKDDFIPTPVKGDKD